MTKVGVASRRALRRRTVKVLAFHWASQEPPAWRISVPEAESMVQGKPATSLGNSRGWVTQVGVQKTPHHGPQDMLGAVDPELVVGPEAGAPHGLVNIPLKKGVTVLLKSFIRPSSNTRFLCGRQ